VAAFASFSKWSKFRIPGAFTPPECAANLHITLHGMTPRSATGSRRRVSLLSPPGFIRSDRSRRPMEMWIDHPETWIETRQVHRSWIDVLRRWCRSYETIIFDEDRDAVGRGPTVEASQKAAV